MTLRIPDWGWYSITLSGFNISPLISVMLKNKSAAWWDVFDGIFDYVRNFITINIFRIYWTWQFCAKPNVQLLPAHDRTIHYLMKCQILLLMTRRNLLEKTSVGESDITVRLLTKRMKHEIARSTISKNFPHLVVDQKRSTVTTTFIESSTHRHICHASTSAEGQTYASSNLFLSKQSATITSNRAFTSAQL